MIDIVKLSKSFDAHKVLDNLNLKIETGSTCVIIGPQGKQTLIGKDDISPALRSLLTVNQDQR